MKKILPLITLVLSTALYASADRYLEAKFITNNGATITLPTTTMSFASVTAISGSNTGDVTLGTASGLSLSGQQLSLGVASSGVTGALTGSDWTLFNGKLTSTLTNGHIFIGNGSSVATDVAVSGDVTISNLGVTTIGANKVVATMIGSGAAASGTVATADGSGNVTYSAIPSIAPALTGTIGSPTTITAVGGISFTGSNYTNIKFITGSGGSVTVTANPQIAAGSLVGQYLELIGGANAVTLADGTGLDLNGSWVGGVNSALELIWDGSKWHEISRR